MAAQRRIPGTTPDPHDARSQSHRAHAGAEAERYFDRLNDVCARAGVAHVHRVSSHTKILRTLGRGRVEAILTSASVVDAMGWMADGRAVAIEVKHVGVERLQSGAEAAWRLALSRIEPHQLAMLAACDAAGGLALVVVIHGPDVYAVPWSAVHAAVQAGAASLSRDDLAPHRCDPREPYLRRFLRPAPER